MNSREQLFLDGLPLVDRVARRLGRQLSGRVGEDDLRSVGRMALLDVVKRFDSTRCSFRSYTLKRVKWAMLDAIRRETHGRCLGLIRAELGPDTERQGDRPAAVRSLSALKQGRGLIVTFRADVGPVAYRGDGPEALAAQSEGAAKVRALLVHLDERQRALVERHYFQGEHFDVIAADLGISKSWASRLHKQALADLASRLSTPTEPVRAPVATKARLRRTGSLPRSRRNLSTGTRPRSSPL